MNPLLDLTDFFFVQLTILHAPQVTVERDLQIRRTFKDVPLLWSLLELTARYRPALAYCSVLLRAIAATVLANWSPTEGVLLANVMALGLLLPPPLASIRDILPNVKQHQVSFVYKIRT